jgi:hypothetical protein
LINIKAFLKKTFTKKKINFKTMRRRSLISVPVIGMQPLPFGAYNRAVTPRRKRGGAVDWHHLGSEALHIAQSKELAPVRDFLLHKAMQKVGAGYSMGGLLVDGGIMVGGEPPYPHPMHGTSRSHSASRHHPLSQHHHPLHGHQPSHPVHPSHHMLHPAHHLGAYDRQVKGVGTPKGGTKSPTGKSQEQIYAERLHNLAKARAVKASHKHHGAGYSMY